MHHPTTARKTPGLEARWASQRWWEEGKGRKNRKGGGGKWESARLARGAAESSIGRVRKYNPEGQIIYTGFNDTLTVVSETDSY